VCSSDLKTVLFRQSDVPEVAELAWVLGCVTPHGLLERAHAFKDARAKGLEVNAGLFNYPVLMAADILIYKSHLVPVGQDQKQHIEITRDIAEKFNRTFGKVFIVPQALISEETGVILGLDGRKMSKSYGNTIMLFEPEESIYKKVMRIVTDSTPLGHPLNPDKCTVFAFHRLFNPEGLEELRQRYLEGSIGYAEAKKWLFEKMMEKLRPLRERWAELRRQPEYVEQVLREGGEKARAVARETMREVRQAVGVGGLR